MAYFSHIIQPFVTVTASSNTHTIDFSKAGNNYKISVNNAANTINFSNLNAAKIGKSGSIIILLLYFSKFAMSGLPSCAKKL